MTSIIRETHIAASPAAVWDALRDFGALHERLVPGFVVDSQLDGARTRVVTFFNGAVAREVLVGIDDRARRMAYSVVESPLGCSHYNASAQAFDDGAEGCRFVWTVDVLPDTVGPVVGQMMERGIQVIRQTLESGAVAS
jgi:carbon monoxide dehydrogenase subunit G